MWASPLYHAQFGSWNYCLFGDVEMPGVVGRIACSDELKVFEGLVVFQGSTSSGRSGLLLGCVVVVDVEVGPVHSRSVVVLILEVGYWEWQLLAWRDA